MLFLTLKALWCFKRHLFIEIFLMASDEEWGNLHIRQMQAYISFSWAYVSFSGAYVSFSGDLLFWGKDYYFNFSAYADYN